MRYESMGRMDVYAVVPTRYLFLQNFVLARCCTFLIQSTFSRNGVRDVSLSTFLCSFHDDTKNKNKKCVDDNARKRRNKSCSGKKRKVFFALCGARHYSSRFPLPSSEKKNLLEQAHHLGKLSNETLIVSQWLFRSYGYKLHELCSTVMQGNISAEYEVRPHWLIVYQDSKGYLFVNYIRPVHTI